MAATEAQKPWLAIEIPRIGRREFANASEVVNWIQNQEIRRWEPIRNAIPSNMQDTRQFAERVLSGFVRLLEAVRRADQAARATGAQAHAQAIEREISAAFTKDCLSVSAPEVEFLAHFIRPWPPVYGGLAEFVLKRHFSPDTLRTTPELGYLLGILQEEGVVKRGDYEPIRRLHDEWKEKHEQVKREFDLWLAAAKIENDQFTERYKQVQIAAEPVSYWNEKKKRHRWGAIAFGVFFVVLAVAGGAVADPLDGNDSTGGRRRHKGIGERRSYGPPVNSGPTAVRQASRSTRPILGSPNS